MIPIIILIFAAVFFFIYGFTKKQASVKVSQLLVFAVVFLIAGAWVLFFATSSTVIRNFVQRNPLVGTGFISLIGCSAWSFGFMFVGEVISKLFRARGEQSKN